MILVIHPGRAPDLVECGTRPATISDKLGGAIPTEAVSTDRGLSVWVADDWRVREFNETASVFVSAHSQIMHVIAGPCVIAARNLINAAQPLPFVLDDGPFLHAESLRCHAALVMPTLSDGDIGTPYGWAEGVRELSRMLRGHYERAADGYARTKVDGVAAIFYALGFKVIPEEDDRTLIARLKTATGIAHHQ